MQKFKNNLQNRSDSDNGINLNYSDDDVKQDLKKLTNINGYSKYANLKDDEEDELNKQLETDRLEDLLISENNNADSEIEKKK
ncbi:hypothetical protein M0813_22878 [Anaeramoeba flamelloides]|uniref:Uncharacterized protein n=1 Tax=Anaeramoeba flamelloides TaxID=1746091 RepID=A0ABQ8YBZ3_9EUKA|nr:hypothetical protein M0813_22878 [Anaeramoeba flamelloides]